MNYIYLAGTQRTFPACVARHVYVSGVTKNTFEGSPTVVFEIAFTHLRHDTALSAIADACPFVRVVCASRPIFVGLSPKNTVVWSVRLSDSPAVLFSMLSQTPAAWEDAQPQPSMQKVHSTKFYTKVMGIGGKCAGQMVHTQADKSGRLYMEDECFVTVNGRHSANHFRVQKGETSTVVTNPPSSLHVGDSIAYLLPIIPVDEQLNFIVTKVVGLDHTHPCFVELENGHHNNILSSGKFHLSKYCDVTHRVQFPVARLSDFK